MNWTGRKVLVTGAGGFIGSHLAERLIELGACVRAFIHYNGQGRRGWLDASDKASQMEIVAGDIADPGVVSDAVKGREIVFHLAALIAIPYSYIAPESYVRTNISGTLNVLQAARAAGISRLVHTSTSEVYGTARRVPIDETHPLQGQSPYSASKIGADKMVEAFGRSFGVPSVTVRPFNTYGPRQSARAVIPTIITQCLAGQPVRLGNMHPTRDMNFVSDTVEGFVLAASAREALGATINLGTGVETSIGQIADLIMELTKRKVPIQTDSARVRPTGSEVDRLLADNSLAKSILGWSPAVPLVEGLKRTIAWFEKNRTGYRPDIYNV